MRISRALLVLSVLGLGACSTVMEANRPAPVNLAKYSVGEKRLDVIATLGAPKSTVQDGDKSCDVYELYTKGNNRAQKTAVILGEAGADLFTLGLFEVLATPAEAASKSRPHIVLVCYASDGTLALVRDEGRDVNHHGAATPAGAQPATPTAAH
jgi:hypothetical protein